MEHARGDEKVEKLWEDMYRGDPPGTGMTTRMAIVEQEVQKLSKTAWLVLSAAVVTLLTVVGNIVSTHWK